MRLGNTFAARHSQDGHESEQRIDRKRSVAVRGETVLFIDERKRLEGRHPATCPYPADGPMRFEAERKVTNLVADRGEGPDEAATARARTMELFKWNSRNGAAVSSWIKIGGVGRTGDTFCASYASFFPSSLRLAFIICSLLIILYTVDF